MIRFETWDLRYIDHETKSSTKERAGREYSRLYYVVHFLDPQSSRAIYLYDWSGIEPDLSETEHYYAQGFVNFRHGSAFLVVDGLARIIKGRKYHINRDAEGITKIHVKPR